MGGNIDGTFKTKYIWLCYLQFDQRPWTKSYAIFKLILCCSVCVDGSCNLSVNLVSSWSVLVSLAGLIQEVIRLSHQPFRICSAGLKYRSQVIGYRSQVTIKNTCEFAVSSYSYLFLFFSLYLFIPTNLMMSSYFCKTPCSSNNALLKVYCMLGHYLLFSQLRKVLIFFSIVK